MRSRPNVLVFQLRLEYLSSNKGEDKGIVINFSYIRIALSLSIVAYNVSLVYCSSTLNQSRNHHGIEVLF